MQEQRLRRPLLYRPLSCGNMLAEVLTGRIWRAAPGLRHLRGRIDPVSDSKGQSSFAIACAK